MTEIGNTRALVSVDSSLVFYFQPRPLPDFPSKPHPFRQSPVDVVQSLMLAESHRRFAGVGDAKGPIFSQDSRGWAALRGSVFESMPEAKRMSKGLPLPTKRGRLYLYTVTARRGGNAALVGTIFESMAHRMIFTVGCKGNLRCLEPTKKRKGDLDRPDTPGTHHLTSDLERTIFEKIDDIELDKYNIPFARNFAAVNAVVPSKGLLLQMAVSPRPAIKLAMIAARAAEKVGEI
jgi:hypothetical protein